VYSLGEFDEQYRKRFMALSTTNISDALDALGLKGATYGIRPMMQGWGKVVGRAVTLKMTAAGSVKGKTHLGVKAIDLADTGDIIVIDNGGRLDTSCWGGILANGAQMKGVSAVVIDGACRDLDECAEIDFPVFARGTVVATARGRVMEENTNVMIQFGGVQVSPGDVVMADRSGVVIIPWEHVGEVLKKAEQLFEKEESMIKEIRAGRSMIEVDQKYNYEQMLSKK
jgi:regulator of RNase E activity RraA